MIIFLESNKNFIWFHWLEIYQNALNYISGRHIDSIYSRQGLAYNLTRVDKMSHLGLTTVNHQGKL